MMPSAHAYGHPQFGHQTDSAWMHQQSGHHQHPQQSGSGNGAQQQQQQHHQQQQQQQQQFNRLAGGGNHSNAVAGPAAHAQEGGHDNISEENRRTMAFIADLLNENTREAALLELSKKREQVPELALILWHSFGRRFWPAALCTETPLLTIHPGVMTSLLQEIISVYTLLNPSQLTAAASNRVCNALALLQCVASHNDTRTLFLNGEFRSLATACFYERPS